MDHELFILARMREAREHPPAPEPSAPTDA